MFCGLVYAVLVAAHVSEPAVTTVYGVTPRRLWASTAALLSLFGVVIGGLAVARRTSRFGADYGRLAAVVAIVAGLVAAVGNARQARSRYSQRWSGHRQRSSRRRRAAFVLGLIALALGGVS